MPCVLDADFVIAALDTGDKHHRAAARTLTRMLGDGTRMLFSLVNYAEALVRPAQSDETLRTAVDAIDALGVELSVPTSGVARQAARLRTAGISLPDAFALATALAAGASVAAFDARVRRVARDHDVRVEPTRT
jgi:predicted nucleic acid-binding protein